MVIFELRTRTGKKLGALIGLILGGLSFATMFSGLTPFSEGQTVCVALSAVFWGLVYVILQFMHRSVYALTILPLLAIGFTLLYFDMRIRKEGFDLQMRTQHQENI